MTIFNIIKQALAIICLVLLQTSLLPKMSWPINLINLVMIFIFFIGFIYSFRAALIYCLIIGSFLNLFSNLFFGAIIISLIFSIWLASKFFIKFFTNRSFYSIIVLIALAIFFYHILLNFCVFLQTLLINKTVDFRLFYAVSDLQILGQQIIANVFVSSIIFLIIHFLSNKFQTTKVKY